MSDRASGLNPDAHSITLEDFVNVWWEQAIQPKIDSGELAPKTEVDYRRTIEYYALPDWGGYKLSAFDAPLIIKLFYAVEKKHSTAMADRVLRKLNLVFDAARRWKYLRDNPVADARKDLPSYQPEERVIIPQNDLTRLFTVVETHRLANVYRVLLLLGLRIGEVCGLQWRDVNWEHQTLTIRRQVQDMKGGAVVRNTTKTKAGQRVLPLPPQLAAHLEVAFAKKKSIFIFTNDEDGMLTPALFGRHFRGTPKVRTRKDGTPQAIEGIRQKAKLGENVTPHTFRHTMATGLKELGVSEEIRADILGHSKQSITQDYSHRVLEPMRRALAAWEVHVFGSGEQNVPQTVPHVG